MMVNISLEAQAAIRGMISYCEALAEERNAQKRRADFNEDRCRDKDADWMAHDVALVERTRERDEARAQVARLQSLLEATDRQAAIAAQSRELQAVRDQLALAGEPSPKLPAAICSGDYDDVPDSTACLRAGEHVCGKVRE
jgi:16S rRNA G1207 methylase RsmC